MADKFFSKVFLGAMILTAVSFSAHAADHYQVGLEGFYDNYREPEEGVHLDNHAIYGSVTGSYTHNYNQQYFFDADGRLSYGENKYKSASGSAGYSPQYEGELRLKFGTNRQVASGVLSPYAGVGTRLYYDNSANTITSLGFGGYDRDIEQLYAPIGVTYKMPLGAWQLAPNIEYDQLIYGRVHSAISRFTGYDITNAQHDGYGVRGDLMFGKERNGYGWQVGPFIRYWNIDQSDVDQHGAVGWVEPKNVRVQGGLALKVDY